MHIPINIIVKIMMLSNANKKMECKNDGDVDILHWLPN